MNIAIAMTYKPHGTDPDLRLVGRVGVAEPSGNYRLEIWLPVDAAPHFAYRWASYRRNFAYFDELAGKEVKIITSWIACLDPAVALEELEQLVKTTGLLPSIARWQLAGPLKEDHEISSSG